MNIAPNVYKLEQRVEHALAIFKERNPALAERMTWENVDVVVNYRTRRVGGRCAYYRQIDKLRVEVSDHLFANMTEMERTETVQHELAHAVCFRLGVGDNHDAGWKSVCRDMGGDGERTFTTKAVSKRNVIKRVVLADTANAYNLMIATMMKAARIQMVNAKIVPLGSIAINHNDKTYRWASVVNQDVKKIKVLKESAGWKLVG